jgi:hypothetical protein
MKVESLEVDLHAAVTEVAAAAGDRVRSAQLLRERDEAREEVERQRRLVTEGRLRTAEAEARMKMLEERVNSLHERLVGLLAQLPSAQSAAGPVVDLRGTDIPGEGAPPASPVASTEGDWA